MNKGVFLLIFILFFNFANAGEPCSRVQNLAKNLGPPVDQGLLNWCNAFASSDLLSHKMQKMGLLKPGEQIHPLQLAAEQHLQSGRSPNANVNEAIDVTHMPDLLEGMKASGDQLCKRSDLGAETDSTNSIFRNADFRAFRYFVREKGTPSRGECRTNLKSAVPPNDLDTQMQEISRSSWRSDLGTKCKTPLPKLKWKINTTGNFQADIDRALDRGDLAGIFYDVQFVRTKKLEKSIHSSTIIAREPRADGQCYYQIRNTWGEGCQGYRESSDCKNGTFWVPQKELLQNLKGVQWFQ